MKVLVAQLGAASFRYRLFDMQREQLLARGGVERIGSSDVRCFIETGGRLDESSQPVPDHTAAVKLALEQLKDERCLNGPGDLKGIGVRAVQGGKYVGVHRITPEVLAEMERVSPVAPAHNPTHLKGLRQIAETLPEIPLVAAFETGFHETIPARNRTYAVPYEWADKYGVRRWGFQGASHRYIGARTAELLGRRDLRIISCHLAATSSVCAMRDGQSVATTMGMSPQSGVPSFHRVGDFDAFALPVLIAQSGKTLDGLFQELASRGGLFGLSGIDGDMRDLEAAAKEGHERAKLAIDVFVTSVKHAIGAYFVELGQADAIVFTGAVGEKHPAVRAAICEGLEGLGVYLDADANAGVTSGEAIVTLYGSNVPVWVVPTNEELIIARQTKAVLECEKA
ncbi:MAG TPA: acetate/propionate family kinase [Pirellulales bacterium]